MVKVKKQNAVVENSFSLVGISLFDRSEYNPRTNFNEEELQELSKSIKEKGVIQPIVVRQKNNCDGRYEVVCGERRYRAALLAQLDMIPACIRNLSDEEAEELAITENLQRRDMTPIEEANAFARLLNKEKYDYSSLAMRFGKSEVFVRGRVKLIQLIEPFKKMLDEEHITIGVATTLANYSTEIQEIVFAEHYQEGVPSYYSWDRKRPTELQKAINSAYSTNLDRYSFDKKECETCVSNTANFTLFDDELCRNCMNRACLQKKNEEYVLKIAMTLKEQYPEYPFCQSRWVQTHGGVLDKLKEDGHEVLNVDLLFEKEKPVIPVKSDFDSEDEYQEAIDDYQHECTEYDEAIAEREEKIKKGELLPCIHIEHNNACIRYANKENAIQTNIADGELAKLCQKKERNTEICSEKIREELKDYLKQVEITDKELSDIEVHLVYFFMLKEMSYEFAEKLELCRVHYRDILNFNDSQKKMIARTYIIHHLKEMYLATNDVMESNPLRDFMLEHAAGAVEEIDNRLLEVYRKRNERLEERILALKEKEV